MGTSSPQPAPPCEGGQREAPSPHRSGSESHPRVEEGAAHTRSGVRSLDTDQQSFTSRTLGSLKAGLAPDLIPSGGPARKGKAWDLSRFSSVSHSVSGP